MARRLFLERRTYRRNRMQDAARLLPVLGLILIFGPIFIRDDAAGEALTLSGGLVYYLVIWAGLIVLAALVNRSLMQMTGPDTPNEDDAGPPAERP